MNFYYFLPQQTVCTATLIQNLVGIDPDGYSPEILNQLGVYPIVAQENPYDTRLYDVSPTYNIVGEYAVKTWVPTPRPLSEAKEAATVEAKASSNAAAEQLIASSGVSVDIWTGAASQDPASRPPVYNTLLNEMASIGDSLATTLVAIDSATSVDEINNIVNPPTGIINTGRGGGLGPEDLNPSYYVAFNSVSLTEADTELYVPGTDTVIPYDPELPPPYIFDSMGDCFNPGDYTMQIRVAATSEVIAEFVVPNNPASENIPF